MISKQYFNSIAFHSLPLLTPLPFGLSLYLPVKGESISKENDLVPEVLGINLHLRPFSVRPCVSLPAALLTLSSCSISTPFPLVPLSPSTLFKKGEKLGLKLSSSVSAPSLFVQPYAPFITNISPLHFSSLSCSIMR